jgi:hypothetical protein
MHQLSRFPIILGAAMIVAAACGRDTRPSRVSIPNVTLPTEEPVSVPVRITARESPPPEAG